MPTEVYKTEDVNLQDDTTVTLKPASIKYLKRFMKVMNKMQGLKEEEDMADLLVDAAAVLLAKQRPEFWDDDKKEHTEEAEDAFDMPTVHKIIELCGGVKLNDPELLAAAAELAATQAQAQDGKTST